MIHKTLLIRKSEPRRGDQGENSDSKNQLYEVGRSGGRGTWMISITALVLAFFIVKSAAFVDLCGVRSASLGAVAFRQLERGS